MSHRFSHRKAQYYIYQNRLYKNSNAMLEIKYDMNFKF